MKKATALIVEDDPTLVQIFAKALEAAGFETQTAKTGETAWQLLQQYVPSVLVLDLHLPGLSGRDVLLRVRGDGRFAKTRIVIASADAELAESLHDQVDLVLEKPVSFHQLRQLSSRLNPTGLLGPEPPRPK